MFLRWLLATIHLLALPLGLGAVWMRARSLSRTLDADGLRSALTADTFWGVAAVAWIGTGLLRAFGGFEKGTTYYLSHPMFHAKLGLLGVILLLEVWPMVTLVRWRIRAGRKESIDTGLARTFARVSYLQAALIVAMVFAATALARDIRP